MSNIKKGYKQTDIGVIPEDWEVKAVYDIAPLQRGFDLPINNISDGLYPVVFSNGILKTHKEYKVKGPGVVTGRSGTIGKLFYVAKDFWPHNTTLWVTNFKSNSPVFVYYLFNRLNFGSLATGSGVPTLNRNDIHELKIGIPNSKIEQTAIATALSDTDALIAALDKKIAKKQQIKQGAMQQLLTGKKRLPGFSGKWVEKKLGAIGKTYGGLTGKTKDDFGNGDSYYITFLNILNNPVINTDLIERVRIKSTEHQNKALKNDLFFNTSSETPEEVGICSVLLNDIENLYLNSFCFGYRINDNEVHGLFLSYLFRSKQGRELMTSLAQGATRYNLSKSLFNQSLIKMPATKTEQTAIAHILTDMDNEIVQLEKERNKYKEIKAGMMQVLLTGKIRLI